MATSNFSFKCHRKEAGAASRGSSLVYAVNDISFHPFGTFSTAGEPFSSLFTDALIAQMDEMTDVLAAATFIGADGTVNLWDKESKTRLKSKFLSCPFRRS